MANTFKQVVPTAKKRPINEKSFSFDHITSQRFMMPMPICVRETIPNQNIKIGLESFCRPNAMVAPTFGRCRINNRAFFVPMRVLMPRWTEFLESEPIFSLVDNSYGLQTSTPLVDNSDLLNLIVNYSVPGTSLSFNFSYWDGTQMQYANHGPFSKFIFKILVALGYKIIWNSTVTTKYSALPLLAYVKIMIDWYYPSQYINSSVVSAVSPYLQSDSLSARVIPLSILSYMFDIMRDCAYNDSLLVDAWDRPVAPNAGVESSYSIPDITLPGNLPWASATPLVSSDVNNATDNGTPYSHAVASGGLQYSSSITQFQHDMLKALTDYTTRHRLAGVRAVDRYLAEYGINLSSEIMKRSIMIGNDSFNMQFGDVMAHSDTYNNGSGSGAVLGDYAGKGIGYGNHVFNYKLGNEFGYLIIVNTVIPEVGYYQGINKINKHTSILDFYHSDFDGLGVQAVAADEVFVPNDGRLTSMGVAGLSTQVFGFVPRYAEYKQAPSLMSGDFYPGNPNDNVDLTSFNFMRDLQPLFMPNGNETPSSVIHDVNFVLGGDNAQYNRAFYAMYDSNKNPVENFKFIHHFEITQEDDSAPLYETYDFKDVKEAVEIHTQASKVN